MDSPLYSTFWGIVPARVLRWGAVTLLFIAIVYVEGGQMRKDGHDCFEEYDLTSRAVIIF